MLLLLLACHRAEVPTAVVPSGVAWSPWPGLVDVACTEIGCLGLDASGLWAFSPSEPAKRTPAPPVPGALGLTRQGSALAVVVPCPDLGNCTADADGELTPLPMAEPLIAPDETDQDAQARFFAKTFGAAVKTAGRIGFFQLVTPPDGSRVTLLPGAGGTLMRPGAGLRAVRLGVNEATQAWPASLCLHPAGTELYVAAWPDGSLRAVDPLTLQSRWTLPLEGSAYGLYLDPTARLLTLQLEDDAEAGAPSHQRLHPWPLADGETNDERLRARDAPYADATIVVDLAARSIAAALPGRLLRTVDLDSGMLVATGQAVQFIPAPRTP